MLAPVAEKRLNWEQWARAGGPREAGRVRDPGENLQGW